MLCHNGMLQPKKISSRGLWEGESEGWGAGGALQLTIRLSHLLYAMTRFFRSLHICTLNVVQCNPMNTSLERFATLDFQHGQTVRALRHRKPTLTVLLNVDNAWNTHSWCIHYPETYNNFAKCIKDWNNCIILLTQHWLFASTCVHS